LPQIFLARNLCQTRLGFKTPFAAIPFIQPDQEGSEGASAERQGHHIKQGRRPGPFAQGILGRILGEGEED
jgi:hypothetical protein